MSTSKVSKFYEKPLAERVAIVKEFGSLTDGEAALLGKFGALDFEVANRMIENVYSAFPLPLGIATNFVVNGREYLVPFALEEPSVVAAASNAAKLCSGFEAKATEPVMIGQIQLVKVKDPKKAIAAIKKAQRELLEIANAGDSTLVKFGGGARRIEARAISTKRGKMVILHLLVDVRDAMGANAVNTMCERISGRIEEITKAKTRLKIISNLAVHRTVKAKGLWKKEELGEDAIGKVLDAYEFAANDEFRACTHNKGIMNGIDAVVIATGNDFRAVEAGAHAFASRSGKYKPLTKYYSDKQGNLIGEIELPMAVGLVGGATKTHPIAKINVKLLGVKSASELAELIASVGLAQNFAALRALANEGIQKGHMRLHAKNIAVLAGAQGIAIEEIAGQIVKEGNISVSRAKEILGEKEMLTTTGKSPAGGN
ncbi:MAG TPA: hydroxymethylglutaryl-CoA reductase, degradative [Candidatus Diapherotrites archaeon]|uniref:3-hydroxy-3-methylglutaryl coenzyme A reductase n=1 Tax=Candidatus Iainarchaeum sp. TaxID=3101447 RepID=A0A7J4IZN8_9ARCH|nr:hydroxymethylglutaryl-CoA reductase, degradative [Candidatus Diapherotrites archaeon]